jgi:hypothetical protein
VIPTADSNISKVQSFTTEKTTLFLTQKGLSPVEIEEAYLRRSKHVETVQETIEARTPTEGMPSQDSGSPTPSSNSEVAGLRSSKKVLGAPCNVTSVTKCS